MGRDIDVHADIQVLKLSIDQGIDTYPADAGLKGGPSREKDPPSPRFPSGRVRR